MMCVYTDITSCMKCDLHRNQSPLAQDSPDADVFWVGISAVRTDNIFDAPLAGNTRSGKLIDQIENSVNNVSFYKTNVVKCLPIDDKSKIRYPSAKEMQQCYVHLESEMKELNPNVIVLLGKQVASFMLKKQGINYFELSPVFDYKTVTANGHTFLPIHHPSYVLIYKRKLLADYSNNISNLLSSNREFEKLV